MVALTLDNLTQPATADQWNDEELSLAATLDLPTTTWEPGGVERVIFADVALIRQEADVAASIIVQAGFLDFAATGTVTYTDATGQVITLYVTPDPSIPAQNPTGALGWLDVLSDSVYDVQRILSTFAGGTLAIFNTTASTYGPFTPGNYHVAQPSAVGSPNYSNTASLTIPPSTTTTNPVTGATSSGGLIELTVVAHGLTTGDAILVTGVVGTTEANGRWIVTVVDANHITLDGSTFTNAWVSGGTVYLPTLAAFTADVAGTTSDATTPLVVNQSVTSLIGVSVGNTTPWIGSDTESNVALAARCRLKLQAIAVGAPGGAYVAYALLAQQLAPTLTPPQKVSANVTRALLQLDKTTGTATLTIANAAGGSNVQDVAAVQAVEDAYVGVTGFTTVVQGAANHSITVVITVYLPARYNTTANKNLFIAAVQSYFRSIPIGGVTLPGGSAPNTNVVPYDAVLGSVFAVAAANSIPLNTGDVEGTLDGGTSNVQLLVSPVPEVALPGSITMNLVSV